MTSHLDDKLEAEHHHVRESPDIEPIPTDSSISNADVDDSWDLYKKTAQEDASESEAKRVLRKIDLRLMPLLFLMYVFLSGG